MTTEITKRNYTNEFQEAFNKGILNLVAAARIYVEAIDENPKNVQLFAEKFKETIPAGAWSGFEAVGRKWMHPKLLMGGGGQYATRIKRLPYSAQDAIFAGERFPLLTATGDILHVDLREVTKEQADQLFGDRHIRNASEQKAYLETRKAQGPIPEDAEPMPYTITDGQVIFRRGTILTRQEIKRILEKM